MINVSNVELVNPPMTVTPSPFEINAPPSIPTASGSKAPIVAIAVMKIGRTRVPAASKSASRVDSPSRSL